jgi:hypothetical protein
MNEQERFEAILIECLAAMEAGEQTEQLVARHPADAAQLDAALRVAARLTASGDDTLRAVPAAQEYARAAFLARAASMHIKSPSPSRVLWLVRPLVSFLAAVVLLAMIGTGMFSVSAASLPGDPLYSVKRSFENVQLSLARDPVQRVNLEECYCQRRIEEVRAVQASKRTASVEFVALVEAMNAEGWIIGGFPVQVSPATLIEGALHAGDLVEVTGHTLPDGRIVADRVEVQENEFVGAVEAMNAPVWVIGGQRVLVTSETRVTGAARLGAQAGVHVRMFPDGTRLALKIEFDDHDTLPLPRPTATPMPQLTSTPYPTQIPIAPPQTVDPHERERDDITPEADGSRDDHATPEPKPSERHDKDTPEPTESHDDEPERDNAHTPEPKHDDSD